MNQAQMKKMLAFTATAFVAGMSQQAHAAITCSVTATGVTGIYAVTSALDLTGQFSINCNRVTGDPTSQTLYIGINQGETAVTGRAMLRQQTTNTAANRLNYLLFRNSNVPGSTWSDGTGRATTSNTAGGLLITANFGTGNTFSTTIPYYFRVAANITGKAAGIYDDEQVRVQVRLPPATGAITGTTGTQLATALFTTNASILSRCYFSITPTPLNMSYVAFAPTPSTGSNNFSVNCTLSTPYTMALSSTSGVLVGLNYSLALSATSSVGTGFAENFNVVGTIAAGQAGTCATSSCSATSAPQTITITY
jgi:Spore Coat Protein U domain